MRKPMPQPITFIDLQKKIDELVAKHGAEDAYFIIDASLKQENIPYGKDTSLAHFIINTVCDEFGINPFAIFNKRYTDLRPRWSAFYFILEHTELRYKDIAWRFDLDTIGPVQYGHRQIETLMSQPKIDKQHHAYHIEAGKKIKAFIEKARHGKRV